MDLNFFGSKFSTSQKIQSNIHFIFQNSKLEGKEGLWFRMSNFRMSNDLFRQRVKFFDRISISRNLFEGNLSQRIMSKQNSLKQNYDKENSLK